MTTQARNEDGPERDAVVDTVLRYARAVDSRDWPLYRSCFTDEVEVDLSSWSGQPPGRLSAEDWVAGVRAGLSGFDATEHRNTDHAVEIDGDRARCRSSIRASHRLGEECCVLIGHYDHELLRTASGWRIARNVLRVERSEGPRDVFERAAERFARATD